MNDDRACEIVRLLDSIDTTLRALLAHQCECDKVVNVHNECVDTADIALAVRRAVRREMRT